MIVVPSSIASAFVVHLARPRSMPIAFDVDRAFDLACALAAIGWLALALAAVLEGRARRRDCASPEGERSRIGDDRSRAETLRSIAGAIALAECVGYVALLSSALGEIDGTRASFRDLDGVGAAFESRRALCAGWVHYLAFDLLLGRRLIRREGERGVPVCLTLGLTAPLTLLAGPVGYVWSETFAQRALGRGKGGQKSPSKRA